MDRSKVERIELAPGSSISRIIKGGWHLAGGHGNIDPDQAVRDMAGFVEAGITTFDCADIYTGVEELIGRFRVQFPELAKEVQIIPSLFRIIPFSRPSHRKTSKAPSTAR